MRTCEECGKEESRCHCNQPRWDSDRADEPHPIRISRDGMGVRVQLQGASTYVTVATAQEAHDLLTDHCPDGETVRVQWDVRPWDAVAGIRKAIK